MRLALRTLFSAVILSGLGRFSPQAATVIPQGAEWSYFRGTESPRNGDRPWWESESGIQAWPSAPAPFRYGDGRGGTLLDDMRDRYTTLYFYRTFEVQDPSQFSALDLGVNFDDGLIIWINGQRLIQENAPSSPSFKSRATGTHESGEFEIFEFRDPPSVLQPGLNRIAVHGFNISPESSDFYFDLHLRGIEIDHVAPHLIDITPAPGKVPWLDQITLRFSEPVQGIDTAAFKLGGKSPTTLVAEGSLWHLKFEPPGYGETPISWAPKQNITDYARPPNPWKPALPAANFRYHVIDEQAPTLTRIRPAPNTSLKSLDTLELFFNEAVTGFDHSDLRINGSPPKKVTGMLNGPWRIEFDPVAGDSATITWHPTQNIQDLASKPNRFIPHDWAYQIDAGLSPESVFINEISSSSESGLLDEDQEATDWIELKNEGTTTVNLDAWSISDQAGLPGKWTFPKVLIEPGGFLVLYASGKDRRNPEGPLHTNFRLDSNGERLRLYNGELPRQKMDEIKPTFPKQARPLTYGRDRHDQLGFMTSPSPGEENLTEGFLTFMAGPRIDRKSSLFRSPFMLTMTPPNSGATIRYTRDASIPTENHGAVYLKPIPITENTVIRARAFAPNAVPSACVTRSYIKSDTNEGTMLPTLSLVSEESNLWGQTGIMESNPRNTNKHGIEWERPVSVELLSSPTTQKGFQIDAGLRIQGGMAIRERYRRAPGRTVGKYSFRLYFRKRYGEDRLDYTLFPTIPTSSFKQIVLRAGMNDAHNPFLVDELNRRLFGDIGQVSSQGCFVNLFLNGKYQGYYNPTERIDKDFLQSRHGGSGDWDLIAQFGEVREGDMNEWNRFKRLTIERDLGQSENYQRVIRELDVDNFIDYIMVCVYADMDDWPGNNWRAARERRSNARWRFYIWDAERSYGSNSPRINGRRARDVTGNNLTEGALTGGSDIARIFQSLLESPEFRLRFADRVHQHFFNGGALTDENISRRHSGMVAELESVIPRMNPYIAEEWIPNRRAIALDLFKRLDLQRSSNAPQFNQHGGNVSRGFEVSVVQGEGPVYLTQDGTDPAQASNPLQPEQRFVRPLAINQTTEIQARTWQNGRWSALTRALFIPSPSRHPVRISEIMYHPIGGSEYEYIELFNPSESVASLRWFRFEGIDFQFQIGDQLAAGERLLLASDKNPAAFRARYPRLKVSGWFGGNLSNGGETITLRDQHQQSQTVLTYDDRGGWPTQADGGGHSLELIDPLGDPSNPKKWRASSEIGGTPGQ